MALENSEVLQNLTLQLDQVTEQLNSLTNTRIRLLGAIEVLQQIEQSKIGVGNTAAETDVVEENE
tara:strand:- start:95 stop:289 length:195 start_codon:yes stop_codon:yes gene_type:complete